MKNPQKHCKKHYMTYFAFTQMCPSKEEFIKLQWENNLKCPYCRRKGKVYRLNIRPKMARCNKCKREFSVFRNTVFEKTRVDLRKWHYTLQYVCEHEPDITVHKLKDKIQVTYKTAWRMLNLIRGNKRGSEEA